MTIAALISACRPNRKPKSKNAKPVVLAILVAALSISPALAQARGAGMGTAGFGISVGPGASGRGMPMGGTPRFHEGKAPGRGTVLLSYPYFYSDWDYYAREGSQQPPQVIVVSAAPPHLLPSRQPRVSHCLSNCREIVLCAPLYRPAPWDLNSCVMIQNTPLRLSPPVDNLD